ncbi:MAG TPA: hypothetical protein VFP05_19500 [Thermomicrobiales bacterium]|nr:hypothetical protein [Thermomicrobiales bacterium]
MSLRRIECVVLAVVLAGLLAGATRPAGAQTATASPEQQLAENFAPIVMIKSQTQECSEDGEQFRPVSVDILFGTDDVRLMKKNASGKDGAEVKRNIEASDLYGLDDQYYLDLPGNPRNPGCDYETWGKERMAELGMKPSIYARVTTEPGRDGIVVQYWFYWVFNLFNNTHESDWEGIQLTFDANTVEEVLDTGLLPSSIAFAQHEGGEQANWNDGKIDKVGNRIVAHPSSGSHADYYQSAVWLGWGENGSGFGCDYSNEPDDELPVDIILLPNEVTDPTSEFAWLTFTGEWGQIQSPSMFSGPTGPITKPRWDHPITWSESIRQNSLPVPLHSTIGPSISQVFCGAAEFGSKIVQLFPVDPRVIMGVIAGLFGGLLLIMILAWRFFVRAVRMYFKYGYVFITTGVIAFPIAWAGQKIEDWANDNVFTRIDQHLASGTARDLYQFVIQAGLGGIQEVLLACLIGPVVIYATWKLVQGEKLTFRRMWIDALDLFPKVYAATLAASVLIALLAATILLIPVAFYKGVGWFFSPQAVVIDKTSIRAALPVSANRVRGKWLRGLAVVIAVGTLSGLVGPIIGTIGMILDYFSLDRAQLVSAAIYCVLYPIAVIMGTLYYLRASVPPGKTAIYDPESHKEVELPTQTVPM